MPRTETVVSKEPSAVAAHRGVGPGVRVAAGVGAGARRKSWSVSSGSYAAASTHATATLQEPIYVQHEFREGRGRRRPILRGLTAA